MNYKGITPEQLLDYLSDKTLSFGCDLKYKESKNYECILMEYAAKDPNWKYFGLTDNNVWCEEDIYDEFFIIGHPVMIGDVLEKLQELMILENYTGLVLLWANCGFNKSLNDILSGEVGSTCIPRMGGGNFKKTLRFKNKNTQALFEFLVDTFKDKIK